MEYFDGDGEYVYEFDEELDNDDLDDNEEDETDYGTSSKRGKLYSAYIKKQLSKLNNSYRYRAYEDYFQLYPTDRERQTK